MNSILTKAVIVVAWFFLGALAGYSYSADKYELLLKTLEKEAANIEIKAIEDQRNKEYEYYFLSNENAKTVQTSIEQITKDFSAAVSDGLSFRVLNETSSDTNTAALSSDASATSSVQKGRCECSAKDKAKLQRLYEQQLVVARDCDINSTYLNKLIEWYDMISQKSNVKE